MAANIDDCIEEALADIQAIAFGGVAPSLDTQFTAWIAGMFGAPGSAAIFSAAEVPAQRTVLDWWPLHLIASDQIEGPGVNDPGIVGTAAVIDVVVRVLWAVKTSQDQGWITQAQEDAVVLLYQNTWD